MVPVQMSALEHDVGNDAEYAQRDTLLYDLQLNEIERSAILYEAETICWNLTTIFKKGDAPGECDNANQRPALADP